MRARALRRFGESPPTKDAGKAHKTTPLKVLFCDDDITTLLIAQHKFAAEGIEIVAVATAEAAWERYLSDTFDALVTDIVLPGEDGFWLIEKITTTRARLLQRRLPIITVSGNTSREDATPLLGQVGGILHHSKPIAWTALTDWLKTSVRPREASRAD